jgi:hypothetical protein
MDLIMDLLKSNGFDLILTIILKIRDAPKWLNLSHHKTIDKPGVTNEYLKYFVPWFRIPKQVISNQDPHFASTFSKALCASLGVQQNLSMAFHSRTDGQTERMNAWVEQYLRAWTVR